LRPTSDCAPLPLLVLFLVAALPLRRSANR